MEVKEYTDWVSEFGQVSVANRTPIRAAVEVTHRCNNNCVQCYNNLPLTDKAARSKELTYEEHCRILDEISARGCLWLLYTGGEIFARNDFLDIYTYAKHKGLLITLFTNGTLVTPEIADYLAQYPPFSIEITLYGSTRRTYEQVTGIRGSFARCMQGIQLLKDRQLPLKLKAMAIAPNQHELWDMKRFAEDDLGLEFKFDSILNPRCDCSQSPLTVRLSPEEVVKLDLEDPERVKLWRELAIRNKNSCQALKNCKAVWKCSSGLTTYAIDPYGILRMCVISPDGGYDLRNGNFQEGWEQFIYKLRQKEISKQTKCVTCVIRDMCGLCPANAGLENLDEEEPVDFLCQVAHLRAYAFDVPIPPHGDCEYCEGGGRYSEMMRIVEKLKNPN